MEKNYQNVLTKKDIETKESVIECIAEVFSAVMEEEVTPQQVLCVLNLMASFFMVAFPVNLPVIVRIIFAAWFCVAFYQCKRAGMTIED